MTAAERPRVPAALPRRRCCAAVASAAHRPSIAHTIRHGQAAPPRRACAKLGVQVFKCGIAPAALWQEPLHRDLAPKQVRRP